MDKCLSNLAPEWWNGNYIVSTENWRKLIFSIFSHQESLKKILDIQAELIKKQN